MTSSPINERKDTIPTAPHSGWIHISKEEIVPVVPVDLFQIFCCDCLVFL